MPTTKETQGTQTSARAPRNQSANGQMGAANAGSGAYVMPMLHVSVPQSAVNLGFWTVLVGSAVFGVVDPPLAALVAAGVLISRHRQAS